LVSVSPRKADLNQTLFNLGFVAKCRWTASNNMEIFIHPQNFTWFLFFILIYIIFYWDEWSPIYFSTRAFQAFKNGKKLKCLAQRGFKVFVYESFSHQS
jgi:hypothetical protein